MNKKYTIKFEYGFFAGFKGNFFCWSDKPVFLNEKTKEKAIENLKHYNFNFEVKEA